MRKCLPSKVCGQWSRVTVQVLRWHWVLLHWILLLRVRGPERGPARWSLQPSPGHSPLYLRAHAAQWRSTPQKFWSQWKKPLVFVLLHFECWCLIESKFKQRQENRKKENSGDSACIWDLSCNRHYIKLLASISNLAVSIFLNTSLLRVPLNCPLRQFRSFTTHKTLLRSFKNSDAQNI